MPITPLQTQTAGPSTNDSYDIQFQNNVATGNLIVVVYWVGTVARSIIFNPITVTDDQGNSYSVTSRTLNAGSDHALIGIASAIITTGGDKPVVSVGSIGATGGSNSASGAAIFEYPKPDTAVAFAQDASSSNVDSSGSTAMSSGNMTTVYGADLLVAVGTIGDSSAITPGSGFSALYSWTGIGQFVGLVESKDTGSPGSYSGDMTGAGADPWVVLAMTFKILPPVVYNDSIPLGVGSGFTESTSLSTIGSMAAGVGSGLSDDMSDVLLLLATLSTSDALSVFLAEYTTGSIPLGFSTSLSDDGSIGAVQALIFGCSIALSDSELLLASGSVAIGLGSGFTDSTSAVFPTVSAMSVSLLIADSMVQSVSALALWAVQSGLISAPTGSAGGSISLGVLPGLSPSASKVVSDTISAGILAGISNAGAASVASSISAGVGSGFSPSGAQSVAGTINLGAISSVAPSVVLNAQTLAALALALSMQPSSLSSALYILGMAIGMSIADAPSVVMNGQISLDALYSYLVSMPGLISNPGLAKVFARLIDKASVKVKSSNAKLSDKSGNADVVSGGDCS